MIRLQTLRALAIGFQGGERRGRCLLERSAVLFDGGERFTNFGSELDRDLTQSIQYIFDLCLRLLLIEDLAGTAVLCSQSQHILAAESCNRAIQDCSAPGALADFLRDLQRQRAIRLLA